MCIIWTLMLTYYYVYYILIKVKNAGQILSNWHIYKICKSHSSINFMIKKPKIPFSIIPQQYQ